MNYEETLNYLYNQLPMFQRIGGAAYKAGLETSENLSNLLGNPHKAYKTIHVAGTNGKGSTSHVIAAILQENGYKVGLYTSPHLIDFRERIRVNGKMISKEYVTEFVKKIQASSFGGSPSFFELTMMMAFDFFRDENIDIAVIEVGLGGRLDSTNIISPILSIITNISFDHTQFLGNTLPLIAAEKAGIIKANTPVIIGEANDDVRKVFEDKAKSVTAPIIFAEDKSQILSYKRHNDTLIIETLNNGIIVDELSGDCQLKNANTILTSIPVLKNLGLTISPESIKNAFSSVCELTGLNGRWTIVSSNPRTICDTGHNVGGITYIASQLKSEQYKTLRMIIGFVNDKDITHILDLLPKDATYYFTQAAIPRALNSDELMTIASHKGLVGACYCCVKEAYYASLKEASKDDIIFIGGSTFIVADFIALLNHGKL
ncbi:MAG: folylpolyglutamate synthase/dihydrofolate synthase family protein [Muribaculaceae bacterium]